MAKGPTNTELNAEYRAAMRKKIEDADLERLKAAGCGPDDPRLNEEQLADLLRRVRREAAPQYGKYHLIKDLILQYGEDHGVELVEKDAAW